MPFRLCGRTLLRTRGSARDDPDEPGPRAGADGQYGTAGPIRVADVHAGGGGSDLNALAAVPRAVTALEPHQLGSGRHGAMNGPPSAA